MLAVLFRSEFLDALRVSLSRPFLLLISSEILNGAFAYATSQCMDVTVLTIAFHLLFSLRCIPNISTTPPYCFLRSRSRVPDRKNKMSLAPSVLSPSIISSHLMNSTGCISFKSQARQVHAFFDTDTPYRLFASHQVY